MKKKIVLALLFILCSWLAVTAAEDVPGTDLAAFEKAKLLIFDKQWAAALGRLAEVIERHPESRYYATALFYRGKCLEELGEKKQALESYEKFVANAGESNLAEEARISIVDLAAELVQGGEREFLTKMLNLLAHENKVVSYYAAFKLSYLSDRAVAARALPVLQAILDNEKDEELRDRAKIAVMRIDPARLKAMDHRDKDVTERMLKIRVVDKRNRKEEVSLTIPLALADLALKSLSNELKRTLQKRGYDLDRIMDQLTARGMKIDIQEKDEMIKIWVE